jgi:hypothetical protein
MRARAAAAYCCIMQPTPCWAVLARVDYSISMGVCGARNWRARFTAKDPWHNMPAVMRHVP